MMQRLSGDATINPHYHGYFELFNQGHFYESHDVLEQLWLRQKNQPDYEFYKGLIQLAGAFVHLQKNRLKPAAALFRLSRSYLSRYPKIHERLDLESVLVELDRWLTFLERHSFEKNPLSEFETPKLILLSRNNSV